MHKYLLMLKTLKNILESITQLISIFYNAISWTLLTTLKNLFNIVKYILMKISLWTMISTIIIIKILFF